MASLLPEYYARLIESAGSLGMVALIYPGQLMLDVSGALRTEAVAELSTN